jgi:hypothetical protein
VLRVGRKYRITRHDLMAALGMGTGPESIAS